MKVHNAVDDTWDLCIRTMDGHIYPVRSVAFSPDGTRVVSGSVDYTLRLWDAVSGVHLITLEGHTYPVTSVAFSRMGLASCQAPTIEFFDCGMQSAVSI
jgi:WD40 repeat protein